MILEEIGDKRGAANAMLVVSEMQQAGAEHNEAMKFASDALQRCQDLGNKRGQAAALQRQAMAELANDAPEAAVRLALQAKALFRGTEDRANEVGLLNMLAQVSLDKGAKEAENLDGGASAVAKRQRMSIRKNGREASKRARQAIGLSTLSEDKFQEGVSLVFLAQARLLNARFSEALKAASKAELMFNGQGDKVMEARAAVIVAQVHSFDEKKQDKAEELANRALELARRANDYQAEDAAIKILEGIYSKQQAALPPSEVRYDVPVQGVEDVAAASSAAVAEPKGLDPEVVRPKVFDVVKNVTGTEDEVYLDTPLMDTGMDSLSAVAFRNELNRMFQGINLPASLMFDYPSVNQITDHIVEQTQMKA